MIRKHRQRSGGTGRPSRFSPGRAKAAPSRAAKPPAPAVRPAPPSTPPPEARERGGPGGWIYGIHAALAAIANPRRRVHRILVAEEQAAELRPRLEAAGRSAGDRATPAAQTVSREELERSLSRGAVHQGLAVRADEIEESDLDDVLRAIADAASARLLVLDQVTDPHNVGAMLRSACAFGVAAVIMPERHAPAASAVMAKAASGALERVPLVRVVNLARAIDQLKEAEIWCVGLAGDAPQSLATADLSGRIALILGSEGDGLRRLTRERCDLLVRIPMAREAVDSLNVSNAAAIGLYELARRG